MVLLCSSAVAACAEETKRPLEISSRPIPLASGEDVPKAIGRLAHLGTLRLTSPDGDFGGISGLIVSDDGTRFLAITDSSHWLTGTLQYKGKQLAAVRGSEIAPLLNAAGKPLQGKEGDAEGLAGTLDGDVYVSFERNHRILRYAFGKNGLTAVPSQVHTPPELAKAPDNGGLEAITLLKDGRLLAVTESYDDPDGNIRAWNIDLDKKSHQPLIIKRRQPFDITDIRQLESGDIMTLERRFSSIGGVGFEVRNFPLIALKPGAAIESEVIADAAMNFTIDNMEGLAVRKGENGETLVYMISDDNFNRPLQQTLLMLFELKD